MALFPVTGRYIGDHIPHLVAADTDDTMDELAAMVARHSVGKKVPVPPGGPVYDVYIGGRRIDPGVTLGALGLSPMAWVDVVPRGAEAP
ncbi:toluene 4-monooxygenase protein B [Pseudonocardia thermophila]|jgi:hypothetical protein|uniref:Toluene 4-monooxygenase protein B n=1 Tax=Pseudonocardia thermophila TaxID=1848 RepID=A0A1M6PPG9_PSETH|nr:toluene-4-monooxygenase system B family protein [Pseudonocardia thermophila]SHK09728.1 toluene 4-monooxygenase protein B [Pseudonocardia thermophila]